MIWNDTFPVGGGKSLNASKEFVMNMYNLNTEMQKVLNDHHRRTTR
jgi:hypothetical protein